VGSTGDCNAILQLREYVAMKRRQRIIYTAEQRALMWDRYQQGDSLADIARLFDRHHPSIERIIAERVMSG